MKADMKKNVSLDTSGRSLEHKIPFSLSMKRKRPKEKIKVCLETSNGTLTLSMSEIHKTLSNGKIVVRGKSF
ncbi:hypothetical protein [Shimazuella kribbensis]|uniref:hypothetical protein n=1 Tax=Shimazuella kribbensis TaxID=139808 RepID=UPI0003FD905D|nr:hypothetical protein [Shimazuella kribbensis]